MKGVEEVSYLLAFKLICKYKYKHRKYIFFEMDKKYTYQILELKLLKGEGNGNPLQYSCLENPWTEEPGRLSSMGSLGVRHD